MQTKTQNFLVPNSGIQVLRPVPELGKGDNMDNNQIFTMVFVTLLMVIVILVADSLRQEQQITELEQQQYADRRYIVYLESYLGNCVLYYDYDKIKERWTER